MLGLGAECLEELNRLTTDRTHIEHCARRIGREPDPLQLVGHGHRPLFLELVHDTQDRLEPGSHTRLGELGQQQPAIVHPELVAVDVERTHEVAHECEHLAVGGGRRGPDDVDVALQELAPAACLRVLAAPDGADVVAPERHPDRLAMLGREPGERNGEIEPERDISIPVVAEAVDLPLHFAVRVQLPEQDLAVLERGRLDRCEPEVPEHSLGDLDASLPDDRALRQLIGEALQRASLDARRHWTKVPGRFGPVRVVCRRSTKRR